jgi:hypothetical protein
MHGREPKSVLLAVFIAAIAGCSQGKSTDSNVRSKLLAAAVDEDRGRPPVQCPPEELSCGLQEPVVSDGVHRFVNSEMGLSAIFPRGSRVCKARSGDAPRGFYASYDSSIHGCPESGDGHGAAMGINSSWNSSFNTSLRQAVDKCNPLSPQIVRELSGRRLSIPGVRVLVCEEETPEGATDVTVYAMARKESAWPKNVPTTLYFASLELDRAQEAHDLRMFSTFLKHLRIGIPTPPDD